MYFHLSKDESFYFFFFLLFIFLRIGLSSVGQQAYLHSIRACVKRLDHAWYIWTQSWPFVFIGLAVVVRQTNIGCHVVRATCVGMCCVRDDPLFYIFDAYEQIRDMFVRLLPSDAITTNAETDQSEFWDFCLFFLLWETALRKEELSTIYLRAVRLWSQWKYFSLMIILHNIWEIIRTRLWMVYFIIIEETTNDYITLAWYLFFL